MSTASPENNAWLTELVERSPLLPDPVLRRHWLRLIPCLPLPARYELAAILLEIEHACRA
jgi:hypothetical protein